MKCKWFIIALLVSLAVNVYQYNPSGVVEPSGTDTVTSVIIDSVSLIRAKAELNYLREHPKTKIVEVRDTVNNTDTVFITEYFEPRFVAKIDTTFEHSYLTAKYFYPENEFTILHKYNYKPVVQQIPKIFEHGIQFGLGYGIVHSNFDFYIGYGVQINL